MHLRAPLLRFWLLWHSTATTRQGAPQLNRWRTSLPQRPALRSEEGARAFEQLWIEVHAEYIETLKALHAATDEACSTPTDHELDILTVQKARSFTASAENAAPVPRSTM